ncbi:MAG TPA: response regulator [bacterium]|nr:response regulator [bacterium]HOL47367.1 response regulator [bacterium]HPQ18900.1 response regulator [bacterium]
MTNKKVLLVDDDKNLCFILAHNLKVNKYESLLAYDGEEAVKILKEKHNEIFLVITDLSMPKLNGIELTKIIKKEYPDIEIILLTAFGSEKVVEEALKYNISAFMSKPLDIEELLFLVKKSEEIHNLRVKVKNIIETKSEIKEYSEYLDLYENISFELRKAEEKNKEKISILKNFIMSKFNIDELPEKIKNIIKEE